jgi:hypothetical protein
MSIIIKLSKYVELTFRWSETVLKIVFIEYKMGKFHPNSWNRLEQCT